MDFMKEAREVLTNNNIDGKSTKPSPTLYPHQWLWDSCFIALGYSHFDLKRAKNELRGLMEGQWSNGMLPHIKFNPEAKDYFPSPEEWNTPESKLTSGITQPPVPAITVWSIYQKDKDKEFLEEVYEPLVKYHEYLKNERGGPLLSIIHPWESGMDNSPLWDEALSRINVRESLSYERLDDKKVNPEERPTKKDYDKYMELLRIFGENEYDMKKIKEKSEFIIEDVLFNSIWIQANKCLAAISNELGNEESRFIEMANEATTELKKLKKNNLFYSRDVKTGNLIEKKSCSSIMPLYCGIANKEEAETIVELIDELTMNYPVCSYSPKEKDFDSVKYWRGPVWVNINWLAIKGLKRYGYTTKAEFIKDKTIELLMKNGFKEYFSPESGRGYGGSQFSWSAALAIDLLN